MDNAYALAQWHRALRTAATTPDDLTRTRAQDRAGRWARVLAGLRAGTLTLGSRTPVRGQPAWVTPEVVRGGFATGAAAAGGPLTDAERELARRAGVPELRGALFHHLLTEHGMRRLWEVLDAGTYEVDVPEASAQLVVAWLVREGETDAALRVVRELLPHADDLRFVPVALDVPVRRPDVMWRETAGDAATALRAARPRPRIERMNEVLDVWNPYADALLAHWLDVPAGVLDVPAGVFAPDGAAAARDPRGTAGDGGRGGAGAGPDATSVRAWLDAGRGLLAEFDRLAREHTAPARHTNPKQNAATLRLALAGLVDGRELTPRERGRVRVAVDAMVSRRGAPGSDALTVLRSSQHAQAARPAHAALAHVAAERLASVPPTAGLDDADAFTVPVTHAEAALTGVPAGASMPPSVARTLLRARAGTLSELVASGAVPSAELLAALVPQVTAQVVAEQYPDPALRVLVARAYEAFRRRRSLLLLDLQHQVRPEELPWLAATDPWRVATPATRDVARGTLLRLADEAVTHWPGTILPNPLVAELETLAGAAGLTVPFVQEIAADIFEGRFSARFAAALDLAATATPGSLYARYYGITAEEVARVRTAARPRAAFGDLCTTRAATPGHRWCVTCNGMVVEQAQVLTTHDLASLRAVGFVPSRGWRAAAEGAFAQVAALVGRLDGNRRPQRMLKDTAYAWRQAVWFAAQLDEHEQGAFLAWARDDAGRRAPFARARLGVLLDGLDRPGTQPPLLGWGHRGHWLLGPVPDPGSR